MKFSLLTWLVSRAACDMSTQGVPATGPEASSQKEPEFVSEHNMKAFLEDPPVGHELFKSLIVGLNNSPIVYAISCDPVVCRECITDFWKTATLNKISNRIEATVRKQRVIITEKMIRDALHFGDQPSFPVSFSKDALMPHLLRMGYEGDKRKLMRKLFHPYWRMLIHVIVACLSGRKRWD